MALQKNHLSGNIPKELGSLPNMTNLNLGNNHLTGAIPAELGNASSLAQLVLSDNELRGSVPTSLAGLTGLTRLLVSGNLLFGCLAHELKNITATNDLHATGPDWCPPLPADVCQADGVVPGGADNAALMTDCVALASLQYYWNAHTTLEWVPDQGRIGNWQGVTVGGSPQQGSEFPAVVVPLLTQHYPMLQRNLLYTAITRGRRLVVIVGSRKALAMAVRNDRPGKRNSMLRVRLEGRQTGNGTAFPEGDLERPSFL